MIASAAVEHEGRIFTGRAHSDALDAAMEDIQSAGIVDGETPDMRASELITAFAKGECQGFTTDRGHMLDRNLAYMHAVSERQIVDKYPRKRLQSWMINYKGA